MQHKVFSYSTLQDVRHEMARVGVDFPLDEHVDILHTPLRVGERTLQNRLVLQPMEGSDAQVDSSPSELTRRRYLRFASGGAALIWFEAVSIAPEVRASAHQLYLTEQNLPSFQRLVEEIKQTGMKQNGFEPMLIMQATHSGRYSKPEGVPAPLIAYNNPVLEDTPIDPNRILTDDQLKGYEEMFEATARLSERAGFDGLDVKACHRYLACELLSAYTREGEYGGSFENRIRFLLNCVRAAKAGSSARFLVTSRINVYDGFPYPWGFGVKPVDGSLEIDLTEPKRLAGILSLELKYPMLNVTFGNPYKNPHVNRPYDKGNYVPDEHPFEGLARGMRCCKEIQLAHPDLPIIGSAFSYLRQFSPNLASGMIRAGGLAMAGFGRMAFADPDFPNELKTAGEIDKNRVCICCGQCAQLLRAGRPAGCCVRDRAVYQL